MQAPIRLQPILHHRLKIRNLKSDSDHRLQPVPSLPSSRARRQAPSRLVPNTSLINDWVQVRNRWPQVKQAHNTRTTSIGQPLMPLQQASKHPNPHLNSKLACSKSRLQLKQGINEPHLIEPLTPCRVRKKADNRLKLHSKRGSTLSVSDLIDYRTSLRAFWLKATLLKAMSHLCAISLTFIYSIQAHPTSLW